MTFELIIYALGVLCISLSFMGAMVFAFIAGQAKGAEIKPADKTEIVVRIDKEDEKKAEIKPADDKEKLKREQLKKKADEAREDMDKAVEAFIARGGLPE